MKTSVTVRGGGRNVDCTCAAHLTFADPRRPEVTRALIEAEVKGLTWKSRPCRVSGGLGSKRQCRGGPGHSHNFRAVPCGQPGLMSHSTYHQPPRHCFSSYIYPLSCFVFAFGVKTSGPFCLHNVFPFLYAPTFPSFAPRPLFPLSQSSSLGNRGKLGLNPAYGTLPAATLAQTHTHTHTVGHIQRVKVNDLTIRREKSERPERPSNY